MTHHRSYELPNNTILGYACYEVTFDSALGTFELVLPDTTDAGELVSSRKHHIFDEPDGQNGKMYNITLDRCHIANYFLVCLYDSAFPLFCGIASVCGVAGSNLMGFSKLIHFWGMSVENFQLRNDLVALWSQLTTTL